MIVLRVAIAIVAFLVIMKLGLMILRGLARPQVDPPAGEMRKVNLRFRCIVCATEVRMTSAPDTLPPPPRHCTEDMELVAPLYD